ncbi:MAG: hypothetical protein KTR26_08065 [Flammeovirgaceae bacterium]|nr:hypothetical protein [Flammeovirgaceae bacterium]
MKKLLCCLLSSGFILLFLISCQEERATAIYDVPEEFEPYVEKFKEEALKRGVVLEINNLIVSFEDISDVEFRCGLCAQIPEDPTYQKRIKINPDVSCWGEFSGQSKEALMFHELGHCILGRLEHKNDTLPNGDFASIMNSSDLYLFIKSVCYPINNDLTKCKDDLYKRNYYLDELFNVNTPAPDWSK